MKKHQEQPPQEIPTNPKPEKTPPIQDPVNNSDWENPNPSYPEKKCFSLMQTPLCNYHSI